MFRPTIQFRLCSPLPLSPWLFPSGGSCDIDSGHTTQKIQWTCPGQRGSYVWIDQSNAANLTTSVRTIISFASLKVVKRIFRWSIPLTQASGLYTIKVSCISNISITGLRAPFMIGPEADFLTRAAERGQAALQFELTMVPV